MWFYLLVLDLLKDFSSLQFRKETVNESFSVGIMLPPLTIPNNWYMLLEIVFRKFLSLYQWVTSAKCNFLASNIFFLCYLGGFRGNCCNFALGILVMGVRFWVMAVTRKEMKKWTMKNYKIQVTLSNQRPWAEMLTCIFIFHFSFKQLRCRAVANPLQIPFKFHSGREDEWAK